MDRGKRFFRWENVGKHSSSFLHSFTVFDIPDLPFIDVSSFIEYKNSKRSEFLYLVGGMNNHCVGILYLNVLMCNFMGDYSL